MEEKIKAYIEGLAILRSLFTRKAREHELQNDKEGSVYYMEKASTLNIILADLRRIVKEVANE